MTINMPVEAMGDFCITCPELDIDILTSITYDIENVNETDTAVKTVKYQNVLRCKHCDRCKVILEHSSETKAKPAKKTTTTRKKQATK